MKTNKILLVALAVMLITACTSVTLAYTITNPGFESNWTGWTNSGAAISTSDHHSGSKSAKCDSSGDQFYQTVTGLSPSTTYTLQAWIMCDSSSSGKIGARNYGGSDVSVTSSSTSWTQKTVVFTTGASNSSVQIYGARVSGVSRYDDFTLSGGSGSTPTPTPSSGSDIKLGLSVSGATADDGNVPANVLDANLSTRFASNGDGAYIILGTNSIATLGKVKIAWYNGSSRQFYFEIYTSTDNKTYTKAYPASGYATSSGTTNGLEEYDFSDRPARYIKVVGHENSYNTWFSPTEIEAWGVPGSPLPTPTPAPTPSPGVAYPYNVLSLTNWKLTAWSYAATALQEYFINGNPPLQTYADNRWFWVSNEGGYNWVNFKAYANYPTTSGSSNPRCELREMTSNGLNEIYWDLTSANQRSMEWICKITQAPSSGKVCIAQIHAKSDSYDDLIRVQVRAAANASIGATGTLYVMGYVCNDTADDIGGYTLGDELHLEIVAVNSTITLNRVNANGSRTQLKRYTGIGSTENYFKAGNYLQSKPTSGTGTVMFRYVRTTPH